MVRQTGRSAEKVTQYASVTVRSLFSDTTRQALMSGPEQFPVKDQCFVQHSSADTGRQEWLRAELRLMLAQLVSRYSIYMLTCS